MRSAAGTNASLMSIIYTHSTTKLSASLWKTCVHAVRIWKHHDSPPFQIKAHELIFSPQRESGSKTSRSHTPQISLFLQQRASRYIGHVDLDCGTFIRHTKVSLRGVTGPMNPEKNSAEWKKCTAVTNVNIMLKFRKFSRTSFKPAQLSCHWMRCVHVSCL